MVPFRLRNACRSAKQHRDFETCSLEIDKLVYRDQVAKVDLAARLVPCIYLLYGSGKEGAEFVFGDDFDGIPGNPFECVH